MRECPNERIALENVAKSLGDPEYGDRADQMVKAIRPDLLALVLNTRAAAARSSGAPAKGEPTRGEPL